MEMPPLEKQTWNDLVDELLIKYNNINIVQKMIAVQLREAQRQLQEETNANKTSK